MWVCMYRGTLASDHILLSVFLRWLLRLKHQVPHEKEEEEEETKTHRGPVCAVFSPIVSHVPDGWYQFCRPRLDSLKPRTAISQSQWPELWAACIKKRQQKKRPEDGEDLFLYPVLKLLLNSL